MLLQKTSVLATSYNILKTIFRFLIQLALTVNEFSVKDSFDAATRINNIPKDLLESNHKFISFDVESLFTNVPISKTINIILKRIYDDKLISTNLRKRTLKKLILDTCTKTAFTFNNKLYEQKDGVSMGSSLGPVLANIIMTELEETIIQQLIENDVIKFYCRYVDDTLMVIEDKYIDFVHKKLNSFDKNLKFTVDLFDKETPHFLDLELSPDGLSIFRKDTNTGLYVNFNSYVPWSYRVSWIRSLVSRAHAICKPDILKLEINLIKKFASWNDFPKAIASAIINRSLNNDDKTDQTNESDPNMDTDVTTIYFRMPYFGDKGVSLIKACINKIRANCIKNRKIVFKILYDVAKTEVFCNNKDKTSFLCQSNVVYKFVCPGCNSSYVGKTERTLSERTTEHAWSSNDSAIKFHLDSCDAFNDILCIHNMSPSLFSDTWFSDAGSDNHRALRIELVQNNTTIIDRHNNWNILLFKEALKIKELKPCLNSGLKASKELQLF